MKAKNGIFWLTEAHFLFYRPQHVEIKFQKEIEIKVVVLCEVGSGNNLGALLIVSTNFSFNTKITLVDFWSNLIVDNPFEMQVIITV